MPSAGDESATFYAELTKCAGEPRPEAHHHTLKFILEAACISYRLPPPDDALTLVATTAACTIAEYDLMFANARFADKTFTVPPSPQQAIVSFKS